MSEVLILVDLTPGGLRPGDPNRVGLDDTLRFST